MLREQWLLVREDKTLKLAKGYWGAKSKHFKMAKEAVMKSGNTLMSEEDLKSVISESCGSQEFPLPAK